MDVKAKRGDAVAWKSTVCYAGEVSGPKVYYELGKITSVTREGLVKKAEKYQGEKKIPLSVDLRNVSGAYIISASEVDVRAMLDAYAVEAPYGFGGRDDGEALNELRRFVRKFLKRVKCKYAPERVNTRGREKGGVNREL